MLQRVLFLLLILCLAPGSALPRFAAEPPTYFAGTPSTRRLAFRYGVGIRPLGLGRDATGVYGLFTQSSFWFLDNEDRGYTVENNFAPEVMLFLHAPRLNEAASWWPSPLSLGFSYSHHSNGLDGPLSRSWNHLNLACFLGEPDRPGWNGQLKLWAPFNIEAGNPDLPAHAGHGRLALEYFKPEGAPLLGWFRLNLITHFSFSSRRPALFTNLEASLSFAPAWLRSPPLGQDPPRYSFFLQWVVGHGLTLIEHAEHQNTVRLGLRLI